MTVVVEASLALKWVVPEDDSWAALALRSQWQASGEYLIGPPIFGFEVTNALYQLVRRGSLQPEYAEDALNALLPSVSIVEPAGLYGAALTIAEQLEMKATYDALYVALAEVDGCDLWTADRKLVRAAQPAFPQVRWVGEAY